MITKIKIDGVERFAVVFDKLDSWEDLQLCSNGLLSLILAACNSDSMENNSIESAIRILQYLQPSISNVLSMERAVTGEVSKIHPMKLQPCEIYIEE